MVTWLYSLPLLALLFVVLALCIGFGVAAVFAARRLGWVISPDDADTAGIMHGFVSLVYAVVLGLMVAGVQAGFEEVEQASAEEAAAVGNFYRTLSGMTPTTRDRLQQETRAYLNLVIDQEWPAMSNGQLSEETWQAIDELTYKTVTYEPSTEHESDLYGQLLTDLHSILDARRLRLHLGQQGIGAVVWLVILAGAVLTIGFIAAFPVAEFNPHLVKTSVMATMFGLMIFLILSMDHPLRGRLSVSPDAFLQVRTNMDRIENDGRR